MVRHAVMSLGALIAAAVVGLAPVGAAAPAQPFAYTTTVVEKRDPACKTPSGDCARIKLTYPTFTRAPTDAVRQALNKVVSAFILTNVSGDPLKTIADVIDDFFRQAAEWRRSSPQGPPAWDSEKVVNIEYNATGIISLDFSQYLWAGGVHPNSWSKLASYSALTGRRLTLKDLLVLGFESKLTAIAERIFREQKKLSPKASLAAAGYFVEKNGKFSLNDNFMITAKGLVFLFNDYEIAAYVVGPTVLVLPYSQIRHLIRADGPLAAIAR